MELREVDVRIVTATHRDLRGMVDDSAFRADLFYRLNVVPLHLSPLRERREEIVPLLQHYLTHFNQQHGRHLQWEIEALDALVEYRWPGNIRELINLVERLVVVCVGAEIGMLDLPAEYRVSTIPRPADTDLPLRRVVESAERSAILRALQQFGTTRAAAKALGISQATVVQKMKRWERTD